VTGAAGFIGASLVRRLLEDGDHVVAAVRPGSDSWRLEGVAGDIELVEIDVTDADGVARAMHDGRPERVFHLAAHGSYSWETDPGRIRETNVTGMANLLDAARASRCEMLVNAGSSSEYGLKDHAPSEAEAPEPNSDYAASKLEATRLGALARRDGPRVVTLRLYSVYGPFEDPRRLVPRLVAHGLRGELPPLVRPQTGRDFVWVGDAVQAMLAAAESAQSVAGHVFNIGTGTQTTVGELVELARRTLSIAAQPDWETMPQRQWDTDVWVADPRRAETELGWAPGTSLPEGFEKTVDWLRENRTYWPRYGVR
jgi:dolichol-phosphate mannosyltransferase